MTKAQFKHDFLRGLGSAIIELQTCDNPARYYEIVKYGCLHNTTYDMQCEGDRGWYLHEAAVLTGRADEIEAALIERYMGRFSNDWLFEQITAILRHFAQAGSNISLRSLYHKYESYFGVLTGKRKHTFVWPERDQFDGLCVLLVSIDGWNAFKRITRDIAELLLPISVDNFFDDWFLIEAKESFGKKRVENYLQKKAYKSEAIRLYLDTAIEWSNRTYDEIPVPTSEDIFESIGERLIGRGRIMRFIRTASQEDLEKLANAAMAEPDLQRMAELLSGFRNKEYPFPTEYLWGLTESDNEDLKDTAYKILALTPSAEVRERALNMIRDGKDISYACSLLAKNLKREDEAVLYNAVKSLQIHKDSGWWHVAFMVIEDGIKDAHINPRTDILTYMYRENLCSLCRRRIVKLMRKKRVLPDSVLQECRFDSSSETRKFAIRLYKKTRRIQATTEVN